MTDMISMPCTAPVSRGLFGRDIDGTPIHHCRCGWDAYQDVAGSLTHDSEAARSPAQAPRDDRGEVYYRLSTGGGTSPLAPVHLYTAAEVHSWAARQSKCLSDADRAGLVDGVESAISSGGGSGSAGQFSRGSAAGMPVVRWQLERVTPTGPDAYGYLVAGGVCRYVGRPTAARA